MPCATSASIFFTSSGRAGRLKSSPITCSPHRGVADGGQHVERRGLAAQPIEILANRPRRAAVLPDEDRRDALRDLRRRERLGEQAVGRVVVRIDEPRREHEAVRVDDRIAGGRRDVADLGDPAVDHAHAARPRRRAGAVDERRVDDDEGVGGLAGVWLAARAGRAGKRMAVSSGRTPTAESANTEDCQRESFATSERRREARLDQILPKFLRVFQCLCGLLRSTLLSARRRVGKAADLLESGNHPCRAPARGAWFRA